MIKHHQKTKIFASVLGIIAVICLLTTESYKFYSVQAASFNVECASTDPAAPTEVDVGLYDNTSDLTLDEPVGGGTGYCKLNGALDVNSLTISSNVVLTHDDEDDGGVNITAATMTVTGDIDVDGRGCAGGAVGDGGEGPTIATGICAAGESGAAQYGHGGPGAGHGGVGGENSGGTDGGVTYGSFDDPIFLGSGGSGAAANGTGGAGGGYVSLNISGTLTVDGTISANGDRANNPGSSWGGGGGSGGSINITVGTIGGSGSLSAIGGDGDNEGSWDGGGGAGGRIAVNFTTENDSFVSNLDTSTIVAGGGNNGGSGDAGGVGTLFVSQDTGASGENIELTCNGSSSLPVELDFSSATFSSVNNLTFLGVADGYCEVQNSDDLSANGTITIDANTILTHAAEDPEGVQLNATNITVTGDINANSKGCLGGATSTAGGAPTGAGGSCVVGGTGSGSNGSGGAGAGHGGAGGDSSNGVTGGDAYGDQTNPVLLGAGGGGSAQQVAGIPAGAGGGFIYLNASGTLTIDGDVTANGGNGNGDWAWGGGGGSAGSIKLVAGTIGGTGNVTVDGGVGGNKSSFDGGSGGGGRISFSYGDGSIATLTTSALGGAASGSGSAGSDGTIFEVVDVLFDSPTSSILEQDAGTQTHTITINLSSTSSGDTDVDYTVTGGTATGAGTDYTLADGTATISDGTDSTTFDVTINGDQLDESDETIIIELSDPTNNASLGATTTHTVTITDDDTSGLTFSEASLTGPSEDNTSLSDTYTIVLDAEPTDDVLVTLGYDPNQIVVTDDTDSPFPGDKVTFTNANWNVAQTVKVIAVDNNVDETALGSYTSTITHTIGSTDLNYDGLVVADMDVDVIDNDTASILYDDVDLVEVTEGGTTDTFSLVLETEPTDDVVIDIANAAGQVTFSSDEITFTTADWSTPQVITVTAVDDDVDESSGAATHTATMTFVVSSVDSQYDGYALVDRDAEITDNDESGINLPDPETVTVLENDSETYNVVLDSEPTADVDIDVSLDAAVELLGFSVNPETLTFTSGNYSVNQEITVTHVDDAIDVTGFLDTFDVTHTATSGDANYNGSIAVATLNFTDDDTAGVTITESDAATAATEGSTQDTIEVVLDTMPLGDVVITPASASGDTSFTPSTLTFTFANYSTPQTITVSATNDDIDEDETENDTISFSVSSELDPIYDALDLSGEDITAVVTDDDTAGATLTESDDSSAATEGATDTFTLVLDTEPTVDVTVTITTDAQSSVDLPTLTFTNANWDTPQEVTITATDDAEVESDTHESTISFTFESLDANFDAYELADLTFTVTENDVAQSGGGGSRGGRASGSLGGTSTGGGLSGLLGGETARSLNNGESSDDNDNDRDSNDSNDDDNNGGDSNDNGSGSNGSGGGGSSGGSGGGGSSGGSGGGSFSDTEDHWSNDYVGVLKNKGAIKGKENGEFDPEGKATRAEALKVVMIAFQGFNENDVESGDQIFNDVETDHWAYKYIQEAFNLGIVQGYEDNTFKPNEEISRQEALTLILKAAGLNAQNVELLESVSFTDIEEDYWGYEDILVAYSMGIIKGYPDGEFKPSRVINRAELAKITALAVTYIDSL